MHSGQSRGHRILENAKPLHLESWGQCVCEKLRPVYEKSGEHKVSMEKANGERQLRITGTN